MSLDLEDLKRINLPMRATLGYDEPPFELDTEQLLQLEDGIIGGSTNHPTIARAVLRSLREHKCFARIENWKGIAYRIPHLAEELGLFLRSAANHDFMESDPWGPDPWSALSSWLDTFRKSGWAALDWVDARYSLVFPSDNTPPAEAAKLRGWLEESTDLQKVAIAAQRLAVIDAAGCRDTILSRVDRVSDSLTQRALALGLLSAGGGQRSVKDVLQRDQRNALLVQALEERQWKHFDPYADFDSGDQPEGEEQTA